MRFFTVPVYYDMEWRKRQEGFAAEWFMQHFAVKTEADINLDDSYPLLNYAVHWTIPPVRRFPLFTFPFHIRSTYICTVMYCNG